VGGADRPAALDPRRAEQAAGLRRASGGAVRAYAPPCVPVRRPRRAPPSALGLRHLLRPPPSTLGSGIHLQLAAPLILIRESRIVVREFAGCDADENYNPLPTSASVWPSEDVSMNAFRDQLAHACMDKIKFIMFWMLISKEDYLWHL
jgi:hypothetical protein